MQIGSQVRVWAPRRQGATFKNALGIVRDVTRSLSKPFPLVYFVYFADMGISVWFSEEQLIADATPAADPAA